jgi:hypothetical protein
MKAAHFPAYKNRSGFDFATSKIDEATLRQLHKCEFMDGAQNVVLIRRPAGECIAFAEKRRPRNGKTHATTALSVQTIEHNRRKVRFFSTIELVKVLEQEKAKGKTGQLAEGLTKLDLVILDGLGYVPHAEAEEAFYANLNTLDMVA